MIVMINHSPTDCMCGIFFSKPQYVSVSFLVLRSQPTFLVYIYYFHIWGLHFKYFLGFLTSAPFPQRPHCNRWWKFLFRGTKAISAFLSSLNLSFPSLYLSKLLSNFRIINMISNCASGVSNCSWSSCREGCTR